jgi:hypothetical protein
VSLARHVGVSPWNEARGTPFPEFARLERNQGLS